MRIVIGNFLDQKADVYVCSTNGIVRMDGHRSYLVMGRGAARAMITKFPECQYEFGAQAARHGDLLPPRSRGGRSGSTRTAASVSTSAAACT